MMVRIWKRVWAVQVIVHDALGIMNWSQVPSHTLVAIAEAYVALQTSIHTFLPSRFDDLDLALRRSLYISALVIDGLEEAEKGDPPPLLRTHCTTLIFMAGSHPHLDAELARREREHVGFHAGKLLLLMAGFRRMGRIAESAFAPDAVHAVETLRKAAWRMTPGEKRDELTGGIPLTLHDRWGSLDPFDALARSLDGELDIAPRAIRDALVKQASREDRTREIEVIFQERPGAEDEKGPRSWEDVLPSKELGPDAEARFRELLGRVKNDLRLRRLVEAALEGAETHQQLADRWGVDPRTVRNWLKELKKQLEN